MRSPRTLLFVGTGLLVVAGGGLVVGTSAAPLVFLSAAVLGAVILTIGLISGRRVETTSGPSSSTDPARGERLVRVAEATMVALGTLALLVAILVPSGEAQEHATAHFLTGLVCACLFGALAYPWHPRPGSGTAMFRGIVLSLLAAAAIGAFFESLGGSGYDAANVGHRIELLTTVHNLVTPFAALAIGAVPLGLVTCAVLLPMWAIRRSRAA